MSDSGRTLRDSEDTRTSEEIAQDEEDNRIRQLYSELIRRETSNCRRNHLERLLTDFNEVRSCQ